MRQLDRLLIGVGLGLLLVGGSLGYPYVHSRLAAPSPATLPLPTVEEPTLPASSDDEPVAPESVVTATRTSTGTPTAPPPTAELAPTATLPAPSPQSSVVVPDEQPDDRQETDKSDQRTRYGAPPTRIVVPSLGVDAPVVQVSQSKTWIQGEARPVWNVPNAYAAGWHETSALVGEGGNTVLNGHNTNYGEIFRDIYRLRPGDKVVLHTEKISRTYYVSQTLILPEAGQPIEVRLENARYARSTEDERLTLVTCHPYGSLRNRLIVIGRPAKDMIDSELPEER